MEGKNTAIVLAAGQGKRMNSKVQKQFLELGGKPLLYYSLKCFPGQWLDSRYYFGYRSGVDFLL